MLWPYHSLCRPATPHIRQNFPDRRLVDIPRTIARELTTAHFGRNSTWITHRHRRRQPRHRQPSNHRCSSSTSGNRRLPSVLFPAMRSHGRNAEGRPGARTFGFTKLPWDVRGQCARRRSLGSTPDGSKPSWIDAFDAAGLSDRPVKWLPIRRQDRKRPVQG